VLTDEIPDPTHLQLRTWVNGELRQNGNTHTLIFDVPAIIAFLTQQLTLEPGDVIATGTPAGVGLGMKPQVWLQPGGHDQNGDRRDRRAGEPGRRLTSVQVPALVSPGGGFGIDLWNPSAMQLEIPDHLVHDRPLGALVHPCQLQDLTIAVWLCRAGHRAPRRRAAAC